MTAEPAPWVWAWFYLGAVWPQAGFSVLCAASVLWGLLGGRVGEHSTCLR